jgi:hypothetical protein
MPDRGRTERRCQPGRAGTLNRRGRSPDRPLHLLPAVQLIGAVRPGPGDTTGRTAFTRRGAIICCSGETTELVTVLKVSGCLGAGQVDDDGQLNQPLPGPGPGGALADGALAGGARRTSAGRALKPPPHEVASVLGAAGDQLVSLMCTRIRALPAEFTLVMVTVRAGRYDGVPAIRRAISVALPRGPNPLRSHRVARFSVPTRSRAEMMADDGLASPRYCRCWLPRDL